MTSKDVNLKTGKQIPVKHDSLRSFILHKYQRPIVNFGVFSIAHVVQRVCLVVHSVVLKDEAM